MGVNITCAVDETGNSVSLSVPPNFRSDLSLKILTHGFADKCADSDKTSAVEGNFFESLVVVVVTQYSPTNSSLDGEVCQDGQRDSC